MSLINPYDRPKSYSDYAGRYIGLTYPKLLQGKFMQWLWRRFMCPRNMHLFDEVLGSGGPPFHYLVCDPCQLMVAIENIDKTYVRKHGV